MTRPPNDTERVHCSSCGHETRHAVIAIRVQSGTDDVSGLSIDWRTTWTMLECMGCETVCLRKAFWYSEEPGDETVTFYPPLVSRPTPKWVGDLPWETERLLREVYAALHADSIALSMMGARALIDIAMQATVGDIGGFEKKLDAMIEQGFISRRNRDVLAAALAAGHAAAHRGHTATTEQAHHVMDIVENLLHAQLLPDAADKLRTSIPPRHVPGVPPSQGESSK